MRTIIGLALAASLLASGASGATLRTLDGRRLAPATLDRRIDGLRAASGAPGLAVALVRNGEVTWLKAYGARNAAGDPLTPDTVMYAASLTKATFATFVMQLVDEAKIDLDRPIGAYLDKPLPDYPRWADLAGDDRWKRLTFRILLDHTSGFANLRRFEPDKRLRFHRDPGARYGYSGEGLLLAQFVIEEGLKLDVPAEMQRRLFDPLGMTRTALTWRDSLEPAADVFAKDGAQWFDHPHRGKVGAAGSMDTTPRDWSRFLAFVSRGAGLSPRAFGEMTRPQIAIDSPRQFPTLDEARTDENAAIALGYGLGWGVFTTPYGPAFFKEGHDDGTANYALCVKPCRACVLLMANSDKAEGVFKALVELLMGDVRLPWKWESYDPVAEPRQSLRDSSP